MLGSVGHVHNIIITLDNDTGNAQKCVKRVMIMQEAKVIAYQVVQEAKVIGYQVVQSDIAVFIIYLVKFSFLFFLFDCYRLFIFGE